MDVKRREEIGAMMSMAPKDAAREIVAFEERENGDIIVTGRGGAKDIISPGRKPRRYNPQAEEGREDILAPWTLAHLNQAADLEVVLQGRGLEWVNEFPDKAPIRAWALWRHFATREGITMAQAADEKDFCFQARRIILACGWLDEESVAHLDEAIKAPTPQ